MHGLHRLALVMAASIGASIYCSNSAQAQQVVPPGYEVDDLLVGACRLKPKLIRLGTRSSRLGPRRVIMTTGVDCGIKQGEYIAYDASNLDTARRHWTRQAKRGDAQAQNYLGEMYERGLGSERHYQRAFQWYEKAAEQGLSAAQFNLAKLYELGLGVDVDPDRALYWHRRASGLPDLTAEQIARKKQEEELWSSPVVPPEVGAPVIEMIAPKLTAVRGIKVVSSMGNQSVRQIVGRVTSSASLNALTINGSPIDVLSSGLFEATVSVTSREGTLVRIVATDSNNRTSEVSFLLRVTPNSGFGSYHALLIGIENYDTLNRLETPVNDVREVARILEERYGFFVRPPLIDATRAKILAELNRLKNELSPEDNLLIYYAGHGELDEENDRGHWLPKDAKRDDTTNWISNTSVTDLLNLMKARGVLVVSDSCYAGTLVNLRSNEQITIDIEVLRRQRSRTVLASGGRKPVLDSGSNGHSVFANAFIDALRANDGVFDAAQLLLQIRPKVSAAAQALHVEQVPLHAPINTAGHENGAFFFVKSAPVTGFIPDTGDSVNTLFGMNGKGQDFIRPAELSGWQLSRELSVVH